jgi:hypothetical protein
VVVGPGAAIGMISARAPRMRDGNIFGLSRAHSAQLEPRPLFFAKLVHCQIVSPLCVTDRPVVE